MFEYAELPPEALNARTRKRYQVFFVNPELAKLVRFAPICPTCAKFVQLFPVQRSILNPSSLFELSVHDRLTTVVEAALPTRFVGALGGGIGVGVGTGVGETVGVGVAVGLGVGVGVGVGLPPHVGNLNDPIRVRQLNWLVVA